MSGFPNGSRPRARDEGLIVERMGDETLVYDSDRDHVHCLGTLAAAVFELSDGSRSSDEIAAMAGHRMREPVDAASVAEAVRQLRDRSLLTPEPTLAGPSLALIHVEPGEGLSRRQMIAAGGALAALPLITTIVAPTPAGAQSAPACVDLQDSCTLDSQCCGNSSGDAECQDDTCCATLQSSCSEDADCCQPPPKSRGGAKPDNVCHDETTTCCATFGSPCEEDEDCCQPIKSSARGNGLTCVKGVCED